MNSKINMVKKTVEKYESSKLNNFVNAVRLGWNSYSFIFYIGSISAILVGIFGWAGWISVIVTILFFYFAGRFKEKVELEKESKKASSKRRPH